MTTRNLQFMFKPATVALIGASQRELRRLKQMAASIERNGRPLIEDPVFSLRIAQVELELKALEITNLREFEAEKHSGDVEPLVERGDESQAI